MHIWGKKQLFKCWDVILKVTRLSNSSCTLFIRVKRVILGLYTGWRLGFLDLLHWLELITWETPHRVFVVLCSSVLRAVAQLVEVIWPEWWHNTCARGTCSRAPPLLPPMEMGPFQGAQPIEGYKLHVLSLVAYQQACFLSSIASMASSQHGLAFLPLFLVLT